jgi:6,7-dimethyl-8-ribityllumazine synthase
MSETAAMSLDLPPSAPVNGAPFRIGLVAARYNPALVDALLHTVFEGLTAAGVKPGHIGLLRVPGSHEVPVAAKWLAESGRHDAVVALGVLIKGGTSHHEVVGLAVTHALQRVALDTGVPVINGVIVVESRKQAEERCLGEINRGGEFARAALEMAALRRGRKPGRRA